MLDCINMDLRAISNWVAGHLETIEHEQRVVRISTTLFDLTADRHDLGPGARNLLRASALVHDVGRSIDNAEHPEIGARMILRSRALRINDAQRRALAYLTFYHRDAVPDLGHEAHLCDSDDRQRLRKVLALLRAADGLDSRSLESPQLEFALKRNRLKVMCYLEEMNGKARRIYQRRKKFKLLEEELDCEVDVDVRESLAAQVA